MATPQSIFFASKASRLRWLVLALIVGCALSINYFLKKEISEQVSDVWLAACDESESTMTCLARIETHHKKCFDRSYASMIFTFGRQRWESFKLLDYEACMNHDEASDAPKLVI